MSYKTIRSNIEFNTINTKVPLENRLETKFIFDNVSNMRKFCDQLESAVTLFVFCTNHAKYWGGWPGHSMAEMFDSWRSSAARDGAMAIYHFAEALDGANKAIFKSKYVADRVDRKLLGEAFDILKSNFPNREGLRHAVAHAGEFWKNEFQVNQHAVTSSFEGYGIIKEGDGILIMTDCFSGDTYINTYKGSILDYKVNMETVSALTEAFVRFCAAICKIQEQ